VVQEATGAYAGLKGSGKLTGTTTFGTDPSGNPTAQLQDTFVL
jgi:hypothetical protein